MRARTDPEGAGPASEPGKRRAARPVKPSRRPAPRVLFGAAALTVAAVGATVTASTQVPSVAETPVAVAQQGTQREIASLSSALAERRQAVSRDAQRRDLAAEAAKRQAAAAEALAKKRAAALAAAEKAAAEKAAAEKAAARKAAQEKAAAEKAAAERAAAERAANAWQLPVHAGAYQLTSRFGECSSLWSSCHTGLDFAAPTGTPIHAVARGTVTEAAYAGAYGNRTIVTLSDGTELWYCHQNSFGVSTGQQVSSGDVIGYVGSTGNVTGPHVHLEVHPGGGAAVDPYGALVAHGVHP